jgi:hypothetical protein
MTAASKRHMGRVAQLPCCLCGAQPVQVHHVREGQGMSQRADDWLAIPLCVDCHTGKRGIHGDRTMLRIRKVGELDLLAETLETLYGGIA